MSFWILIIAVTAIICTVAFYPLIKKTVEKEGNQRDSLNKAFYFDRLKEVETENAAGLIDDPEQTKQELQQSLLDDIPETENNQALSKMNFGTGWFAALMLCVGVVSVGSYLSVGSWFSGAVLDTTHQKLDYFFERVKNEQNEPLTDTEMNQFATALRVELQRKPDDHANWFMLGQLGMATENGQLALDSFARAVKLEPTNIQYNLSYAQVLMFSADPKDKEQGMEVLKQILRTDHTNLDALSMIAFYYFEQEDYKMAAMTWGMMLKFVPDEDPRKETLERSMQSALAMLKEQESKESKESQKDEKNTSENK